MNAPDPHRLRRPAENDFPTAFARTLTSQGRTLEWLRSRLADRGTPVSLATLSYWRSGRSRPERLASLDALDQIESLLRLEPGHLRNRLGPSRRVGPDGASAPIPDIAAMHADSIGDALRRLGFGDGWGMIDLSTHVVLRIDADRALRRVSTRTLWRCQHDRADALPLIYVPSDPDETVPTIGLVRGGSVEQILSDTPNMLAARIAADRPVRWGEEIVVEHELEFPGVSDDCYEHHVVRRMQEVLIWVQFDPARLPASADVYWHDADDGSRIEPVDITGLTTLHHRRRGFGPGSLGIRWRW